MPYILGCIFYFISIINFTIFRSIGRFIYLLTVNFNNKVYKGGWFTFRISISIVIRLCERGCFVFKYSFFIFPATGRTIISTVVVFYFIGCKYFNTRTYRICNIWIRSRPSIIILINAINTDFSFYCLLKTRCNSSVGIKSWLRYVIRAFLSIWIFYF